MDVKEDYRGPPVARDMDILDGRDFSLFAQ